jgi:hypothetical protein|nr:ADP-ribosylglycohydrolase family protein [uncultured Acetatifactor sp.]
MQLTFKEYKDKVKACWLGKNIGGTLGAPFEGYRGVYDVTYYTHDLARGVLPNDDLDLQLIWLHAAERYGKSLNAEILGEYWISYVTADWSEYGAGKNNLRYGLMPPISGWYKNHNKDSCGCFIRSELWACLAPGHPEIAVRYAYEDAICDHADEGMYGEIFCAALESAAFVENDRAKLVEAALSYIPGDCAIAQVVATVQECYQNGIGWKEARKVVLNRFPGSFGMAFGYKDQEPEADVPVGRLGYDAPSNIGIMMIGWYYGEGDFSKSICIAAGCCEDGDCTAGTLGSILGIIGGTAVIEEKWLRPIGDEIKTSSIDMTKGCLSIPWTVTSLTKRVADLMPVFMHGYCTIGEDGAFVFDPVDSICKNTVNTGFFNTFSFSEEIAVSPVRVKKAGCLFDVQVLYDGSLSIRENQPKEFQVKIKNHLHSQQWLECSLKLPEGWSAAPSSTMCINVDQNHGGCAVTEFSFTILPQAITQGRYDLLLEIKSNGRLSRMFLTLPLLAGV